MARRRTPPPSEPWCIISMVAYGSVRTMKLPVSRVVAQNLTTSGWDVLIRDTDMPPRPPADESQPAQEQPLKSNPRRIVDHGEQ